MRRSAAARWAGLLALASLALGAPSGGAQAATEQEQAAAASPRVSGIKWSGNQALSRSELQAVTFTQGPSWRFWRPDPEFSEAALIGDLGRIASLYQLHGYYEARAQYTLAWNRKRTRVSIRIEIEEGLPVRVTALDVELPAGLTPEQQAELLADLPLELGGIFSSNRYSQAKQDLLDRMAEHGHPLAEISGGATVDVLAHEAVVQWKLHPGPPVYLGEISIRGLYQVDESTARREVGLAPGQRYSTTALAETRRNLQRQGLYTWVTVQARPAAAGPAPEQPPSTEENAQAPEEGAKAEEAPAEQEAGEEALEEAEEVPEEDEVPGAEEQEAPAEAARRPLVWPVEIRVTERSPYTIDAGVGYSSDESFRASLGWRNGNFFGDARKLRISGLYSGILSKVEAEFTQPYLFDPKLSMIVRTALRHETEPAYTADRLLTSIGFSRPVFGPWRGRVSYEYSLHDVTKASRAVSIVLTEPEGISNVSRLEFGLRRQTLDDLLKPTRGTWADFVVAPSLNELGSDFDYLTFLIELRGFLPIFWDSVLGGRFRIGAIQPIRGTDAESVPVFDRFYSGGSNSFRGFRYHRMPPNDSILTNVGGTSLLEMSAEWRFPIWRKLGGVLFVDAAQIDLQPFRYPLDSFYWAVGPGLRYDTIVGPLRFDFGILLNPPAIDGDRFQWFISVGHSF